MTTIISDAGVQFAGGNIVDIRSAVPTTGSYTAGDFVLESTTTAKVTGWKRLTTGSGHVLNTDWVYVGGLTLGTAVATTSGTAIDFIGIPSWAKRITVMMHGTSTNGSSNLRFQIGPSGGVETSGYLSSSAIGTTYGLDAGGFSLTSNITSASISSGIATFVLMDSATNLWAYSATTGYSNAAGAGVAGGSKALAGTLSRLKLTTVNGTDTFDAGSVNILYE